MKILITTEFYLPFRCGVTLAVLNEKRALESNGHEVRILTITSEKTSYYHNSVYYIRSNFPQLYKDSYATLAFNDPLVKEILEWKPDIIHSQCEFFTMVFAKRISKKLHIPIVHTCHTDFDSYRIHFTNNEHIWNWATNTFIPRLIKDVAYVICPTSKIYNLLTKYRIKNEMEIIPVGLDLKMLGQECPEVERIKLREKYGFTESQIVFVSICRLSEEKNVEESIAHFVSINRQRPSTRMLIVGDGTEKAKLESIVEALDICEYVKFAGNIPMDTIWKYYDIGDIFISSSTSEIQGLTYIEALASGHPIVCKQDEALAESLIENYNGFSFSTDAEFLQKTLPLIDDVEYRKRIGKNARESVDKYSLDNFANNLLKVFEHVLN